MLGEVCMANEAHKIKLLVLWDILCKNTDENHALNTDEISDLLALRGLNVSRKIFVQDIATLCDNGYEVLSYKKKYLCSTKKLQNIKSTRFSRSCAFLLPYFVVRALCGIFEFRSCILALFQKRGFELSTSP